MWLLKHFVRKLGYFRMVHYALKWNVPLTNVILSVLQSLISQIKVLNRVICKSCPKDDFAVSWSDLSCFPQVTSEKNLLSGGNFELPLNTGFLYVKVVTLSIPSFWGSSCLSEQSFCKEQEKSMSIRLASSNQHLPLAVSSEDRGRHCSLPTCNVSSLQFLLPPLRRKAL